MSRLLEAVDDAAFVFVTGKGGTGKTTTAGGLSLELADSGTHTHLISTDPAHSLADLFGFAIDGTSRCSERLRIEEFDAAATGDAWLSRALGPVSAIVEAGTYLDGDDVAAFSRLALPGIDEMMAVLRLVQLQDEYGGATQPRTRVVVDTAPTGHTLRLLDAADTYEGIARALRAMADKAAAVAGAMTGRAVHLAGEDIIDELEGVVGAYRERVLAQAAFVIAARSGAVVEAETRRLAEGLRRRGLRVTAVVVTGPAMSVPLRDAETLQVPVLEGVSGCDGLRMWRDHVRPGQGRMSGPGPDVPAGSASSPDEPSGVVGSSAVEWLMTFAPRLLLVAGKGGVGKSTCAAAAALALAEDRDVLLCSTDPAGSLADVLAMGAERSAARLRVLQIEPAAQLTRLHEAYEEEVTAALERLGLSASAALDRRVMESLWDLTPPGLDELAATASMLGAAEGGEAVVIDSSPTGHFLRLLEMPEVALGWTRQLMRIFVKYGIAGVAGGAAESLLELSRELRGLRDTLRDGDSAGVLVVTLDQAMVQAETQRLISALEGANVRVAGVLVNRAATSAAADGGPVPGRAYESGIVIHAPDVDPAPVGPAALRGFAQTWNIVA